MTEKVKIEKGIPIPKTSGRVGIASAFRAMKVNDSIHLNGTQARNAFTYARQAGIKITTRTDGNGVRIWRIK
jgi:hypothetical protein